MRSFACLVVLGACVTSRTLTLDPDPNNRPPLGVGLSQAYRVTLEECGGGWPPDGGCADGGPEKLAVSSSLPAAVTVSGIGQTDGFVLTGVAVQTASITMNADGIVDTFPITVAPLASSSVFISRQRESDYVMPDLTSPAQVFADETFAIGQTNVDPNGQQLTGVAPVQLDAGSTVVELAPSVTGECATSSCFSTGQRTGTAVLSTPMTALSFDVVPTTALVDFAVWQEGNMSGSTAGTLQLSTSPYASSKLYFEARDAMGRPIVGLGPWPYVSVANPAVAGVGETETVGWVRSVMMGPREPGTTTITVTWGAASKTFDLVVAPD